MLSGAGGFTLNAGMAGTAGLFANGVGIAAGLPYADASEILDSSGILTDVAQDLQPGVEDSFSMRSDDVLTLLRRPAGSFLMPAILGLGANNAGSPNAPGAPESPGGTGNVGGMGGGSGGGGPINAWKIVSGRAFVPNSRLVRVLEKFGGDRKKAAKKLGLSKGTVDCRIQQAGVGSCLGPYKGDPIVRFEKPDTDVASALSLAEGNVTGVAEFFGVSEPTIRRRILKAGKTSSLGPYRQAILDRHMTRPAATRVSDDDLAVVLGLVNGNRCKAGRMTGMTGENVGRQILEAADGSALAVFKDIVYVHRTPKTVSDAQLAESLKRHGGNKRAVADDVGIKKETIGRRINGAPDGSELGAHKGFVFRPPPRVSDADMAAVLQQESGNRDRAARRLGCDRKYIRDRIENASPGSPLGVFKTVRSGAWGKGNVSDAVLASALVNAGENWTKTAQATGLIRTTVRRRIENAAANSTLAPHKNLPEVRTPPQRAAGARRVEPVISDKVLAKVLAKALGNRAAVARKTGLRVETVRQRVKDSPKGSPLDRFKKMRVRSGPKNDITDARMARALISAGGNETVAAGNLGISTKTYQRRIASAGPGSPLHDFRVLK